MNQPLNGYEPLPPGDESINNLFADHYKGALRTANRILRSKEDAEDAVQTAYFLAFRHLAGFRRESSFKTWFTHIVVNCALMKLRERRREPQLAEENLLQAVGSNTPTPETLCYLAELECAHAKAITVLSKTLYDVYAQSVIFGVPRNEVAEQLGLNTNAAKSRLARARRRVEQALRPMMKRRAA
ncbi:MAG: sigma-70 family RNA polymerase sigma factor [Bryobacteraceae bacterium]